MSAADKTKKRNLLTVVLEDYFHVGALSSLISPSQWDRFEARFEANTLKALDLLDRYDVKATFFVLGWIAERRPDLVAEVARQGHEIANYGFYHRNVRQMTREELRDDSRRSRDALEVACGRRVIGYRIPQGLRFPSDMWMLDTLAEEGYVYDSSVIPLLHAQPGPMERFAHIHRSGEREIWEFPHSTVNLAGFLFPISGGNYFRQMPHWLLKTAVNYWQKSFDAPFMMYFHIWELDPDQPQISAASFLARTRQYRNLNKMSWLLPEYLKKYQFEPIADYLGCDTRVGARPPRPADMVPEIWTEPPAPEAGPRTPVTLVVPCFNERAALPYLANTLESVSRLLNRDYRLSLIFVDDGSTDGTHDVLRRLFENKPGCRIIQHPRNLGVAAAILTGIRHATTDIVCSIDCDCSYDPHELVQMIPLLTDEVDLVTASPYHPQGRVTSVRPWRLALSRGASWLYRQVLHHNLATYTSCFRVYRRSRVVDLQLDEFGYLGVAETLGRLDLQGASIREFPTTLHVRILGHSKMKIARTVLGHLRNLWKLRRMRALLQHSGKLVPLYGPDSPAEKEEVAVDSIHQEKP